MRRLATAAALLLSLTACTTTQPSPPSLATVEGTEKHVLNVHDGDTFRIPEGPVRVLGIDTPEIPGDCYGQEATAATRDLLEGSEVVLTTDPAQPDRDRYGRFLRYVMTDNGEDLAAYLLRYGYARVYEEYPVARTGDYLALQEQARAEKRGGWGDCGW